MSLSRIVVVLLSRHVSLASGNLFVVHFHTASLLESMACVCVNTTKWAAWDNTSIHVWLAIYFLIAYSEMVDRHMVICMVI